jgi:RNA polymerase sigma-70 factor (ECF subfamily)
MTLGDGGSSGSGRAPVPITESTATLIGLVKSGDLAARERLIERFLPVLRRWAHGRLPASARDLLETSDLIQLTLIRTANSLAGIEAQREGAFLAYLRRTFMNQLRNEIRRSARGSASFDMEQLPDGRPSLLEEMVGRRLIDTYETALASLPEALQEAIILSIEFGYSHRELAEAIGSPSPDAARMSVSRALIRLSKAMEQCR